MSIGVARLQADGGHAEEQQPPLPSPLLTHTVTKSRQANLSLAEASVAHPRATTEGEGREEAECHPRSHMSYC